MSGTRPSTSSGASPTRVGLQARSIVDYMDSTTLSATGAAAAFFVPFWVDETWDVNRVLLDITTSSGNIDVGIYDDDGTSGAPGTRLVSSGSVACPAAGSAVVAVAETSLTPGRYYAAFAADNATTALRFAVLAARLSAVQVHRYKQATAFPLPATAGATAEAIDAPPIVLPARV